LATPTPLDEAIDCLTEAIELPAYDIAERALVIAFREADRGGYLPQTPFSR
jgi:hypothetical protein